MHPILQQQIERCGIRAEYLAALPGLIEALNATLEQADTDRQVLERSLELTSGELLDGHLDLLRDLEKRKRLEVQLRETESKWLSLVQASPSLVLTLAPSHAVSSANRPFPGRRPEAMLGRSFFDLVPSEHQAIAREAFESVRTSGAAASFQMRSGPPDDPTIYDVQVLPILADEGLKGLTVIATDITERIQTLEALSRSEEQFRTMFENSPTGIVAATPLGTIRAANPAFSSLLGQESRALQGRSLFESIHPDDRGSALAQLAALERGERITAGLEMRFVREDGAELWVRTSLALIRDRIGAPQWLYAMVEDVTAQKHAEAAQRSMEMQLRQAQKLEGIGQLAAGIAHEINTPTQFIGDNLTFLKRGFEMLAPVLEAGAKIAAAGGDPTPEALAGIAAALKKARCDFLAQQVPKAIDQSLEGVDRVARIVRAMKEFAHPSGAQRTPTNIRHAVENTLTVARNEWKYVAEVETEFDDSMPEVLCFGDELNQVFLNLIVNASHAIAEAIGDSSTRKGRITIRTRYDGTHAEIHFGDNGTGIPEKIRGRIFDPFFTTKEVGKGSGQGLALAHAVVVKKHQGTIVVQSEVGVGTTFIVRLPVEAAPRAQGPEARDSFSDEPEERRAA